MCRIFVDRWSSRILLDVVFGVFFNRSAQKIENGIKAPQAEISLQRIFPSDVPGADVEGHIIEFSLLCFIDQPGPFLG